MIILCSTSYSDYGYEHSDEFSSVCVLDPDVSLPPSSCPEGAVSYTETRGYRKVAGDVCTGGESVNLLPVTRSCCVNNGQCLLTVCLFVCEWCFSQLSILIYCL